MILDFLKISKKLMAIYLWSMFTPIIWIWPTWGSFEERSYSPSKIIATPCTLPWTTIQKMTPKVYLSFSLKVWPKLLEVRCTSTTTTCCVLWTRSCGRMSTRTRIHILKPSSIRQITSDSVSRKFEVIFSNKQGISTALFFLEIVFHDN